MFVFRLEAVLKQRRRQEEEAARALAEEQRKQRDMIARIAQIQEERAVAQARMLEQESAGIRAAEFLLNRQYIDSLTAGIRQSRTDLEAIRADVLKKQTALMRASKRRRMLETLKDKAEQAYISEMNRREALALDEFAVLRTARRMKESGDRVG